jgi:hypothetical protein
MRPDLKAARDYFENVQLKQRSYAFIRPTDQPATWMNKATMDRYRPEMTKPLLRPREMQTYMDQMKAQFGITLSHGEASASQ